MAYNPNDPNVPPRPQFFSPYTAEEAAAVAAWDAMYGPTGTYWNSNNPPPPTTTPPPTIPPPNGAGAAYAPLPPQTGAPGNPYAGVAALMPGYGLSQELYPFGIPGFEQDALVGGGSWAGTTFQPANAPPPLPPPPAPTGDGGGGGGGGGGAQAGQQWGWAYVPYGGGENNVGGMHWVPTLGGMPGMPVQPGTAEYDDLKRAMVAAQADYIYQSQGGSYESIVNSLLANDAWLQATQAQPPNYNTTTDPTTSNPGQFAIGKAKPYTGSPYRMAYGGKPPPYESLQAQTGAAMTGVPPAYPGFAWAGPAAMAAAQPAATGMPPGGWTQMLGYTPGAPANYGFIGNRPNPYGITGLPLGPNPALG
jgi:hypothetical protein